MKIVHFCLSCFYIDGYTYQENMLVREHVKAGHDVIVIASTETFNENGEISHLEPSEYFGHDGAKVIRLPYRSFLPAKVMKKLRMHPNIYKILGDFEPDVIMFHGMCGFELLTVAHYAKNRPEVILYADSHEDFNNSARNFISRNIVYRCFYNPLINLSKKYINKVFYITYETKIFCQKVYKLEDDQLEFLPLGGKILSDTIYGSMREQKRIDMDFKPDDIVFFQSGKFDSRKKLLESLAAFTHIKNDSIKFVVAGNIGLEIATEFQTILDSDERIIFVGWVDSEELIKLLCMCDVYVQPGTQSATMQMSLAARCPIILADVPSHKHIFRDNGFLVSSDNQLEKAINEISTCPSILIKMSDNSYDFAKEFLDYSVLAERLTK